MKLETTQLRRVPAFAWLTEDLNLIHGLGYASKMPCYTYSISARSCRRGSKLRRIPGTVCSVCYACRGNFARPTIQKGLDQRKQAMQHREWSAAIARVLTALEHSGHFRWYSSGDLQSLGDLLKICHVAKLTPHIKHWLPTHEIGILNTFKRAGLTYPGNLIVRLTADRLEQKPSPTTLARLGVLGAAVSRKHFNCPAHDQHNMCMTCRKCWDKRVTVVTYKQT